jgi:hypothetical protein
MRIGSSGPSTSMIWPCGDEDISSRRAQQFRSGVLRLTLAAKTLLSCTPPSVRAPKPVQLNTAVACGYSLKASPMSLKMRRWIGIPALAASV